MSLNPSVWRIFYGIIKRWSKQRQVICVCIFNKLWRTILSQSGDVKFCFKLKNALSPRKQLPVLDFHGFSHVDGTDIFLLCCFACHAILKNLKGVFTLCLFEWGSLTLIHWLTSWAYRSRRSGTYRPWFKRQVVNAVASSKLATTS